MPLLAGNAGGGEYSYCDLLQILKFHRHIITYYYGYINEYQGRAHSIVTLVYGNVITLLQSYSNNYRIDIFGVGKLFVVFWQSFFQNSAF